MSTNRDFSNPNTKFVEVDEMLERKRNERAQPVGGGMFASWNSPIEELDSHVIPEDKKKLILETQAKQQQQAPAQREEPISFPTKASDQINSGVVRIPTQAMKRFRNWMADRETVKIEMTADEADSFLDSLQEMKTPKTMTDAKAIIRLSDDLERIIG